jgi:hypothetical protein
MALVNVASRLDTAILIETDPVPPHWVPLHSYEIVGNRDPGAVGDYGVTYGVDEAVYTAWATANPHMAVNTKIVSQPQIDAAAEAETDPANWGFQTTWPPTDPGPSEPTAAVLTSAAFSDEELEGMIADLAANGSAFLGFDITIDGVTHMLRRKFGGVKTIYDVCTMVNSDIGAYAVTTCPGDAAPWFVLLTSNTTGAGSSISFASAPSALVSGASEDPDDPDPRTATVDISGVMRLITGVATVEQGADAVPGRASAGSRARSPASVAWVHGANY